MSPDRRGGSGGDLLEAQNVSVSTPTVCAPISGRSRKLNESCFPGARTGGEATDTVCASNTRRDAELENALILHS
jgi:hypothetical protein